MLDDLAALFKAVVAEAQTIFDEQAKHNGRLLDLSKLDGLTGRGFRRAQSQAGAGQIKTRRQAMKRLREAFPDTDERIISQALSARMAEISRCNGAPMPDRKIARHPIFNVKEY